jgi:hypothetical protein
MRQDSSRRSRASWPCETSQSSLWHGRPPAKAHDHGLGRSLRPRDPFSLLYSHQGFLPGVHPSFDAVRFACLALIYNQRFWAFGAVADQVLSRSAYAPYRNEVMSHSRFTVMEEILTDRGSDLTEYWYQPVAQRGLGVVLPPVSPGVGVVRSAGSSSGLSSSPDGFQALIARVY